jgi:hypothetical protein
LWLNLIYDFVENNLVDEAIDLLFTKINELLVNKKFECCNTLLKAIEIKRLNIDLLLGLLSITLSAANKLPFRKELILNIEKRIAELAPNRVRSLLKNLY